MAPGGVPAKAHGVEDGCPGVGQRTVDYQKPEVIVAPTVRFSIARETHHPTILPMCARGEDLRPL